MSILCYHEVDPEWQSTLSVTPEAFASQCTWLANRTVLSLDDAAPVAAATGRLPRGTSAITFDDGFPGVGAHAWPILRRHRLPATVFIVAETMVRERQVDWVDTEEPGVLGTMQRSEVEALAADGMTIGSHSLSHHDLTTLSESEVLADLIESREILEDVVGGPVRHIAYPRGRHNARVRQAAEKAGYTWAHALPETRDVGGPWAIPRVGVYPGNGRASMMIKSEPLYAALRTSSIGPRISASIRRARTAFTN